MEKVNALLGTHHFATESTDDNVVMDKIKKLCLAQDGKSYPDIKTSFPLRLAGYSETNDFYVGSDIIGSVRPVTLCIDKNELDSGEGDVVTPYLLVELSIDTGYEDLFASKKPVTVLQHNEFGGMTSAIPVLDQSNKCYIGCDTKTPNVSGFDYSFLYVIPTDLL